MNYQEWLIERQQLTERIKELEAENGIWNNEHTARVDRYDMRHRIRQAQDRGLDIQHRPHILLGSEHNIVVQTY